MIMIVKKTMMTKSMIIEDNRVVIDWTRICVFCYHLRAAGSRSKSDSQVIANVLIVTFFSPVGTRLYLPDISFTLANQVIYYRPRSRGDNTFGSVRVPVRLSVD